MKRTHLNWVAMILTVAGISFAACNSSSQKGDGTVTTVEQSGDTLTVCDFSKVKDTINVPLSEWVEDCRLIHFENIDTALFKMWYLTITDNYIGIRQRENMPFKLFDHQGKYLCDVGQVGKGPGEYSAPVYGEVIDEKNQCIYLSLFYGTDRLLKYNMDGTFNGYVEIGEGLNKPKVALKDDGSLYVIHMPMQKGKMLAAHIAKDGKVEKYVPQEDRQILFQNFDHEIWFYRNVPELTFSYTSLDTLYRYNPEAKCIEARFTMANRPKDQYVSYDELPDKFLATVWGKGVIAVDKATQVSHYVKLVNDFVGGLPAPVTFTDGWFFAMYEPSTLMERIEERLGKSDCTEKDKQLLTQLLASLHENDNNVIMIGKLKQ